MNSINLFFCMCFVAHGFCDFLPLLQTFDKNILINYILSIFGFCYLHLLTPSISTIIFIIISSLHFNQDFLPYDTIKFPSVGLYILSAPIIVDYQIYLDNLEYIGVEYQEFILIMIYIGGILGLINSHKKNDSIYHILLYTLLTIIYGIDALYFYMIYYHLVISICLLIEVYDIKKILILQCLGLIIVTLLYNLLNDLVIEMFYLHKQYFIGALFGLLNSHSLTTLLWRQKEIVLFD